MSPTTTASENTHRLPTSHQHSSNVDKEKLRDRTVRQSDSTSQNARSLPRNSATEIDVCSEIIRGCRHLGSLLPDVSWKDSLSEARSCYLEAINLNKQLCLNYPLRTDFRLQLSDIFLELGINELFHGNGEEDSLLHFECALKTSDELYRLPNISEEVMINRARCYRMIYEVMVRQRDYPKAIENIKKTLELAEAVCSSRPDSSEHVRQLAYLYQMLAALYYQAGQPMNAVRSLYTIFEIRLAELNRNIKGSLGELWRRPNLGE